VLLIMGKNDGTWLARRGQRVARGWVVVSIL
jgi:hypothetical protein